MNGATSRRILYRDGAVLGQDAPTTAVSSNSLVVLDAIAPATYFLFVFRPQYGRGSGTLHVGNNIPLDSTKIFTGRLDDSETRSKR